MKNFVTSALHTLGSRRSDRAWSRLDRQPVSVPELEQIQVEDTSEMRHYLAAQTSQTV